MLDLAVGHTRGRERFGRPLAEFELVREKISWMAAYLYGLESMTYLTTGLVDRGVEDYSLESAMCEVSGTGFGWYQANRALQFAGGVGYMRDAPYEKTLRDPIRSIGVFLGYVGRRIERQIAPERMTLHDPTPRRPRRSGVRAGQAPTSMSNTWLRSGMHHDRTDGDGDRAGAVGCVLCSGADG